MTAPCAHERVPAWRAGTPTSDRAIIRTVAGETLARSWAQCDCGTRLERAVLARSVAPSTR